MSPITTHVLDVTRGKPAAGVNIVLEKREGAGFRELGRGKTDDDGRLKTLMQEGTLSAGDYRLRFDTGAYYAGRGEKTFYPEVVVLFHVEDASQHFHVPILLSPFGYSTYRGS